MKYDKSEYLNYLEEKSPNSPIWKDVLLAFLVGGAICTIGQAVLNIYKNVLNLSEEDTKAAVSITMIFIGALLTGLNIYSKLGKYAGAGTLVPITGFANAIVSPAIEFKREGYVLGLASKMFTIAGPVLVYGITSSVGVGIVYYLVKLIGG